MEMSTWQIKCQNEPNQSTVACTTNFLWVFRQFRNLVKITENHWVIQDALHFNLSVHVHFSRVYRFYFSNLELTFNRIIWLGFDKLRPVFKSLLSSISTVKSTTQNITPGSKYQKTWKPITQRLTPRRVFLVPRLALESHSLAIEEEFLERFYTFWYVMCMEKQANYTRDLLLKIKKSETHKISSICAHRLQELRIVRHRNTRNKKKRRKRFANLLVIHAHQY